MSKTLEIDYKNGETEKRSFPDKLYDLSWKEYRPIEKTLKLNASLNRDNEIEEIHINEDNFIIKLQEAIAKAILNYQNISLDEVKVSTVKRIIKEYGDDQEELNIKLKKNQESSAT